MIAKNMRSATTGDEDGFLAPSNPAAYSAGAATSAVKAGPEGEG
jgi:hypothetical protein